MTPSEGSEGGAPGSDAEPCKIPQADLNTRMQKAVDAVRKAAPNAKIVLTGYCVPTKPECGGPDMTKMQVAGAKMAADNSNLVYVDISTACGGSNSKTSDAQYFVDGIHLNQRGYCKAFSMEAVQTAFGCGSGADASACADTPKSTCSSDGNSAGNKLMLGPLVAQIAAAATLVTTILSIVQ